MLEIPAGYSLELLDTTEDKSQSVLEDVDSVILQAWRDHEPIVAEWLERQPSTAEIDDALVWIVRFGQAIVATGRLTLHAHLSNLPRAYFFGGLDAELPGPIGSINRVAVVQPHGGRGLATLIDRERIAEAKRRGARSVAGICQPRRAQSLVERCGMKILREPRAGEALPEVVWSVVGIRF